MVLQLVGFFVIIGGGAFLLWWAGREFYQFLRYQLCPPFDSEDFWTAIILIILLCVGGGLIYYAATNAPFEITLSIELEGF